jgi:stage II sporulation protein AA (anti-sigma F factor antagonist)
MVDLFSVTSRDFWGGRVFVLCGELDLSSCQGLTEELVGAPGSLVVIDLARLAFIDSSGLGAIHRARQRMEKDGGNLVLCRPQPNVKRVLEITSLDEWVTDWDPEWDASIAELLHDSVWDRTTAQ